MNWKNFMIAGLVGGIAMALLSNLPLIMLGNCLACGWVWVSGLFATWVYARLEGKINVSDGAWLGALAGLVGGIISAIFLLASQDTMGLIPAQVQSLLPTEIAGQLDLISMMRDLVVMLALLELLLMIVVGAIGGLLGGFLLRPKQSELHPDPDIAPLTPGSTAALSQLPISNLPPAAIYTPHLEADVLPNPSLADIAPQSGEDLYQPPERSFIPPPQPRPLEGRVINLPDEDEPFDEPDEAQS